MDAGGGSASRIAPVSPEHTAALQGWVIPSGGFLLDGFTNNCFP